MSSTHFWSELAEDVRRIAGSAKAMGEDLPSEASFRRAARLSKALGKELESLAAGLLAQDPPPKRRSEAVARILRILDGTKDLVASQEPRSRETVAQIAKQLDSAKSLAADTFLPPQGRFPRSPSAPDMPYVSVRERHAMVQGERAVSPLRNALEEMFPNKVVEIHADELQVLLRPRSLASCNRYDLSAETLRLETEWSRGAPFVPYGFFLEPAGSPGGDSGP